MWREWEYKPETGRKHLQNLSKKGQSSKIYTELLRLNKKTSKLTEKWIKDFNRHLIKEDIKITSKHMKQLDNSDKCIIGVVYVESQKEEASMDRNVLLTLGPWFQN